MQHDTMSASSPTTFVAVVTDCAAQLDKATCSTINNRLRSTGSNTPVAADAVRPCHSNRPAWPMHYIGVSCPHY